MNDEVAFPRIPVVAAVLRDGHGHVLLAQRPAGKELAGAWEFPGGKLEPGESSSEALERELREELGIEARIGRRRISVPGERVVLDVYEVEGFFGVPRGHEGQALAWLDPARVNPDWLPAVDRPVLASLKLPDRYLITPSPVPGEEAGFLHAIDVALASGIRLVQLRATDWPRSVLAPLARQVRDACHLAGARVLLNGDWQLAAVLGLDGVHLPAKLAANLGQRPLPNDKLVAVSCHNPAELELASRLGADFATLSPILRTSTHPEMTPLGWEQAADWVRRACLPIYALGGTAPADLANAFARGFQGIAAIRALWR